MAENDAHAFVVGDFVVGDGADGAELLIRPARVDRAGTRKQRRVVVEAAVQVVGMRAEILHLEAAAAPQLALEAGAPLIHAAGGLIRRRSDDQSAAVAAGKRAGGRHSQRIGQAERRQSRGPVALKDRAPWRIRVQERIAVRLIRVVIDAAAAAEHGLLADPIGKTHARRPVLVLRGDELETGRRDDQSALVGIQNARVRR